MANTNIDVGINVILEDSAKFEASLKKLTQRLNEAFNMSGVSTVPLENIRRKLQSIEGNAAQASASVVKSWANAFRQIVTNAQQAGTGRYNLWDVLRKGMPEVLQDLEKGNTAVSNFVNKQKRIWEDYASSIDRSMSKMRSMKSGIFNRYGSVPGFREGAYHAYGVPETSPREMYEKYLRLEPNYIKNAKDLGASIKAIDKRVKEFKKMPKDQYGDPVVLEYVTRKYEKLRDTLNMKLHGMEGNRLSIRNFSLSLSVLKRDMIDLITWQARWYGAKALLFTPLQGAMQGIKDFISWEQAMKNVNAVSDATAEDMKKLEDTTLKVGKTTATSAVEAAKAMLEFAQAGVDVDTIQKALPVSAKMVTATQEDISTAVSALTTIYNVWREDAQDMETVGGKLAASMAESKLKVADLSTVFNYLATSSKLAGISLSDTLTLVTALSQAGVKASTIGTGLGNFISRMTTIKGEWKKTLESKGLNISELTLPENSMIEVLKKLKAAGVDVIDLFKGLEIRAGRTAGALLSMVDRLDDISSKINQPGILEKMFGKSMEGIDNQLKNMKNKLQVFFLELGRDSIGGIQNLVSVLQSLVDILISLKTEIQMVAYALAIRLGVGAIGFLIGNVKELIKWFKAFKWELLGIVSEKWWITIGITFVIWFNAKMQETMDKEKIKIKEYVSNLSKEEAQTLKEALEKRGKTVIPFEGVTDKELKKKYQTSLRGFYKAGGERYGLKDIEEELNKAVIPELSSHTPVPEKIKQRDTSVKEKIKKSFREQLSLEEKARKDELTLTKSFNDLKMSILDNARKLNLLSEEKYYEQSIETAKENFDNDIRIAEATYAQFEKGGKIYEEYLNDKELEKDSTKQLQLDQRFLTEKREAEIKVLTLQNDKTKELLRLYTEEEARIQKVADEYAKLYEVSYDIAEQTKAQTEKGISERQIVTNEYLYGKMKISSEKYYNEEYNRIELDLRHAKDAATRKADIAIAEANRRLRGQDPGILIKEEEKINEEKNKEINAAEETALKERLNLHYKYLEDLRALYQSKGTAAVTGKILEDLSIQSLDMANNLKSAVESISSSMESSFMDFLDHTSEGFLKWENLVTNVLNEITKELIKVYIVKQLIGGIQGVIGGWFSSGETDVAGLQNLMPGGYRASGGPVSLNRAYLVGEQGPELFVPNSNGNIVPNNKLNTGSNVQVNVINQTSRPVEGRQSEAKFDGEKWVVGVVLKELTNNYGPLRHAVKGVR